MINIEKIGKLRVFIVAKDDRKPVSGVRITLSAITGIDAIVPLATLSSDHAGYVSFSITRIVARGISAVKDLTVEVDGDESSRTSVGKWLGAMKPSSGHESMPPDSQPQPGCTALTIATERPPTADSAGCSCNAPPTGTSVQEPDSCDYELSPNSFLIRPAVRTGDGDCERIVPSSLPVNRYSLREVVIRAPKDALPTRPGAAVSGGHLSLPLSSHLIETTNTAESFADANMAPVDTHARFVPRNGLRFGELLEYEQIWFSLGHSLGEIKYSLALAPGEATQVAVIDWSRTDSILRADQVDSTEKLRHQQNFNRQIDEAVNAALSEKQGGGSFQGGLGAAASGALKGFNLGADLALGGAVTNSWGDRDLSGDSLQNIHAKVVQASTLTRSLTSTVVVQASQSERNTLSTHAVANHNHCHALTIVYYEVLRHLCVRTALRSRRWVVMIPFAVIDFSKVDNILRFRAALEPGLLDARRAEGFDAFERLQSDDYFEWPTPATPSAGAPSPALPRAGSAVDEGSPHTSQTPVRQFEITLRSTSWNWGTTYGEIVVRVRHRQTNTWTEIWKKKRVGDGGTELNKITFPQSETSRSEWFAEDLGDVQVGWREDNGMDSWDFAGITVRYRVDQARGDSWFTLVDENGHAEYDHGLQGGKMKVICHFDDSQEMTYSPTLRGMPYDPGAEPEQPSGNSPPLSSDERKQQAALRREADNGAFIRLKNHLMTNEGYYSRMVWMNMDRSERQVILESALENFPELFRAIDDRPVAVSGNRVAFAFAGDPPAWLGTLSREAPVPEESIVTFPTPGIFAEAQLGHCNACEERDITRMWNWAELPTEQLPQIEGISPGPRGQTPNVQPAQLPANVLNVVSTPTVPDPTGLAAALKVLGIPDIFRDMSGLDEVSKLLETLSKESSEANIKALANQAKDKLDQAKSGSGGKTGASGGGSAGTGQTRTQASETDATKQVDRLKAVEYAQRKGMATDQTAQNATKGILGGEQITLVSATSPVWKMVGGGDVLLRGVDVSHHQQVIDWQKVKNDEVSFAFIKATEGATEDNRFQFNWSESQNVGMIVGAYHYFRAGVAVDRQSDAFFRAVGTRRPPQLPLAVDVETIGNDLTALGITPAEFVARLKAFCDTIEGFYNVRPIIYTSAAEWKSLTDDSEDFADYPLWVANVARNDTLPGGIVDQPGNDIPGSPVEPLIPPAWRGGWYFWQYSWKGKIDGIVPFVDLDLFNGNLTDLTRFAGFKITYET